MGHAILNNQERQVVVVGRSPQLGAPAGFHDVVVRLHGTSVNWFGSLAQRIADRLAAQNWIVNQVLPERGYFSPYWYYKVSLTVGNAYSDADVHRQIISDLAPVYDVTEVTFLSPGFESSPGNSTVGGESNTTVNYQPSGSSAPNNSNPLGGAGGLDLSSLAIGGLSGTVVVLGIVFLLAMQGRK